jgi:hypothetical protein
VHESDWIINKNQYNTPGCYTTETEIISLNSVNQLIFEMVAGDEFLNI